MNFSSLALLVSLSGMLGGCSVTSPLLPVMAGNGSSSMKLTMLSGDAAIEPAFVRVALIDRTLAAGYRAQALPVSWESAVVRLHSTDATAKLTQDRVATINRAGGFTDGAGNSTTNAAAFTNLRPGNYIFQVALFTGADATGTNAAVHTTNLALVGGSSTALTVTMKTTDGADATSGGTVLNTTVSDTTGFVRSSATNSTLGGPAGIPVVVAGDTLVLDPLLSDSTANGGATVTSGGSGTSLVADLDPGVLSRVVVSYARETVSPTGATLLAGETLLTDWVRANNEPIRGVTWASLADSGDGGTWPARGAATRTGAGTFEGTFNWNTVAGNFAAAFSDESDLSENYRLIYRYYDNTYGHNLIRVRTQPLAVVAPASINLKVE